MTLVLSGLALSPALALNLACGGAEQPGPTKVEGNGQPFDRGAARPQKDPNDPLRNPAIETPRGPDGDQLPAAEIDAVLAEAAEFAKIANVAQERNLLRSCANKTPASARCDGRMGLSLIPVKNRRATAIYYLLSAASVDEPAADAALYVSVSEQLRSHGQIAAAIAAMDKAVARDPSAENLFAFGQTLSLAPEALAPEGLRDGAQRMAEARAKDDRLEWLYEEAVVRGQIPLREEAQQAIVLFKEYIARAQAQPPASLPAPLAPLDGRMAELEVLAKSYPSAAELDGPKPAPEPADD